MTEDPEMNGPSAKAVKTDDASVPVRLWTNRIVKKLKEYWREMDLVEKRPDFSEDRHWSWIESLSTLFRRAMFEMVEEEGREKFYFVV